MKPVKPSLTARKPVRQKSAPATFAAAKAASATGGVIAEIAAKYITNMFAANGEAPN